MSTNYTGVASNATARTNAAVTIPADADTRNAASVNTAFQRLADVESFLMANTVLMGAGAANTTPITVAAASGTDAIISTGLTTGAGANLTGGASGPAVILNAPASPVRGALFLNSQTTPSSPSNGDVWYDGTDINCRIGGTTYVFAKNQIVAPYMLSAYLDTGPVGSTLTMVTFGATNGSNGLIQFLVPNNCRAYFIRHLCGTAGVGGTLTCTMYVNGSPTSLQSSGLASGTGSTPVTLTAGQLVSIVISTGSTTTSAKAIQATIAISQQ